MSPLPTGPAETLGFLFAPASRYPEPTAYIADRDGTILHTWTHAADQPHPADDPPSYLRGWNHVEMDHGGNLFAIVPLRSLIKLSPSSELVWSCDVSAHHDIAVAADGTVLVLAETPRQVTTGVGAHVVLDNLVITVNAAGAVSAEASLYDILRTDPGLRRLIDGAIHRRSTVFRARGWPGHSDGVADALADETLAILRTGSYHGEPRRALQRLRALPGSPCDVLHTNTLEILDAHPGGVWSRGDVLVCLRELDTIAVVDLAEARVRWWWGQGELSGPHQPTMLPDGKVLIFDNGRDTRSTRLLAVDPQTRQIVWSWAADPPGSFFCPLAGGCEPLPNGNILVTNSTAGSGFELTTDGRIVWQLTLPPAVYGQGRGRVSIYRMSAVNTNSLHLQCVPTQQPRMLSTAENGRPRAEVNGGLP